MRQTGQGGFEDRGVIGFPGFAAAFNAGQIDERKSGKDHEHHAPEDRVRQDERVKIHRRAGFRFMAKEQVAADGGRDDVGTGVERLRHRQPPRRAVLRAKHGHVGIRGGFNAREPAGENKERQAERPKRLEHQSRRDEQERAKSQGRQPNQDAPLVADATNQQRRRKSRRANTRRRRTSGRGPTAPC